MFDAVALMLSVIGYVFLTWVIIMGLGVIYITLIHIHAYAQEMRKKAVKDSLPFNVKDTTNDDPGDYARSI